MGSRGNVIAKLFTLAYRVLKLAVVSFWLIASAVHAADDSVVVVGGTGTDCIPSRRFYAVTGIPVKNEGEVPPDMQYLQSDVTAGLANLSNDINLAARNAVSEIVDIIVKTYGYNRQQAYIIASVAVDLRIAQLVDATNVGDTAILPLDIFNQN